MTVTPFKVEFFKDKNQSLKMVKKKILFDL